MSANTIHWIQVQLWEYSQVAGLHQQVFSYTDEIQNLAKNIFIPNENKSWPSPFYWFKNWVFNVWKNIWWGGYEAELNRIPGRILPANKKNKAALIWNTTIWVRKPHNIIWNISIPGILPINGKWATWLFQFNSIEHSEFYPKWGQLLNIDWKDNHGNILATIDWVQW